MEPEPTFAEAARILRPGGVFAAYDYNVPPAIEPEVDEAFERWFSARRSQVRMGASRWPKDGHLVRIQASGCFRWTRELVLHGETEGGVNRVVGLARSIGPPVAGLPIDELEATARRVLGDRVVPWLVSYRVRLGGR